MTRRGFLLWAACYGLVLATAAGTLCVVRAALPADSRAAYAEMISRGATLLVIAALFALVLSALLAQWLARTYFAPLRRHAELVKLMADSNPALRFDGASAMPMELRELSRAINQLADRNQQNLREVEQRIRDTHASLARERGQLAALLSDLAQSVVVCNAEGRVLLYNEQARQLLRGPPPQGFLGLGRSLHDVLDASIMAREYGRLRERLAQGEPRPVSEFDIALCRGGSVQARMAPVQRGDDAAGERPLAEGYVLLLAESPVHTMPPVPDTADTEDVAALAGRPVYYDFDLFHQPGQTQEIDEQPLRQLAYTVFDTETTGLNPGGGDEIISIGAIRIVNGRLLPGETFQQLIDPRRRMRADSIRVHGITPDMLQGKPLIDAVLPSFHRFCEGTVLVGHNAAFDMRFLELKAITSGVRFTAPVLDTLLLSAALHGDRLEHSLESIAARLGVEVVDRHTALGDAITTARVFLKLTALLAAKGITTLGQARTACAETTYARIRY